MNTAGLGVRPFAWAKEAEAERKLNTEVKVLDTTISNLEVTLVGVKAAVRDLNRKKDVSGARAMFMRMTSVMKQIARFKQLHNVCSNMLERVKEQAVMSSTAVVMQHFVSVHEDLIKECNLDKLVSQYERLQDNVDNIRSGFDDIASTSASLEDNEPNWDDELNKWLADEDDDIVQPRQITAPAAEVMPTKPSVVEIASSFPDVPWYDHAGGTVYTPRAHNPYPPPSTTLSTIDRSEKVAVADSNVPVPQSTPPAPATVWPEVPTPANNASSSAVRDLKVLFGDAVVNKSVEPLTD